MDTITLYRPVGLKELELIAAAGWKAYPPRLEWQPIFYPVMNEEYAAQIAKQWNTGDEFSGYCGVVTAFVMPAAYVSKYEVQNVGGGIHNELWVPAEELAEWNANILSGIYVATAFFGEKFAMPSDDVLNDVLTKFR